MQYTESFDKWGWRNVEYFTAFVVAVIVVCFYAAYHMTRPRGGDGA